MTTQRSKRKFSWWPGDVEWLSQKVEKWLVFGNGYSKLRASISTRSCNSTSDHEELKPRRAERSTSVPAQPSEPQSNKFKMCLKYGEEVCKNYSEKLQGSRRQLPVTRSFSAKEGKKPIQRQDWARSSYSLKRRNDESCVPRREGSFKLKTLQRFTSNVVPSEVIFKKCKPRERQTIPCETKPCWDEVVPCCVRSADVIYYPFREEDCVVCKYMMSASRFRMNVEPLEHIACTNEGCHFLYGSKSFPCNSGQLHAGCKMAPTTSLVNTMSRCTLRETRIANEEPDAFYENNFQTQPNININQNYIEVCYDDNIDEVNGNASVRDSSSESEEIVVYRPKPERPPPTYTSVMRQERVRPRKCTYQHQDGEDRFYVHESPFLDNARYPPSYYSCASAEGNGFNFNRASNLVPRRTNTMPRQNTREGPRYRSRGRLSHSLYETERAVSYALEDNGNSWSSNLRRGSSFSYYKPASATVVDNQSPRYQLREVDLRSSNPLRNVMSIRSRNGKSSGRRKKSVVVGEDGLQGPMWPRVLLTFDRGVTPNAPPYASGQYVSSAESEA